MRAQAETISRLRVANEQLRVDNERLAARVAELERQVATNSQNSSKPPSQDVFAKPAPRSLRRRSGRRPGKQPGAPGASLTVVDDPDKVIDHVPAGCVGGGRDVTGAPTVGVVRRQVHDLPEIRPWVVEHRLHRRRCRCGTVTTAASPPGVTALACYGPEITALAAYLLTYQHIPVARAAQLLADVAGMPVSTGWVAGVLPRAEPALEPFAEAARAAVRAAPVAHFDETGLRVEGQLRWLHSASTAEVTTYLLHDKRGVKAMNAFGILPDYTGVAVHDGWHSYRDYTQASHALCNAHHLRELQAAAETHPEQDWPQGLARALEELNHAAHAARATGAEHIPTDTLAALIGRFDHHLHTGLELHPRNHRGHPQGGKPRQTTARRLLQRLRDRHAEVLRFAFDLRVPFTNNQAERDLRMTKTQLKLTGGWRTRTGATAWLTMRSYISTARKNGLHILTALRNTLTGHPWLPATS